MAYPIEHKKLINLVGEQPTYASVLYQLGIPFYQFPRKTLAELCKERRWDMRSIVLQLEQAVKAGGMWRLDRWGRLQHGLPHSGSGLQEYPIEAVIIYLKHSHGLFIRQQLPYMADLIGNIEESCFDSRDIAKDLKFIFPLFVSDFIHHIHEEEDTVFEHIMELSRLLQEKPFPSAYRLFLRLEKHQIEHFALEHLEDDDEMLGIRQLTNNYRVEPGSSPHTKVIYQALREFEEILSSHAKIENDILMPKAQKLEDRAQGLIKEISVLN